jgi:hypothetical protein
MQGIFALPRELGFGPRDDLAGGDRVLVPGGPDFSVRRPVFEFDAGLLGQASAG